MIKKLVSVALCGVLCSSCAQAASWSLVERGYIKKIPAIYANHQTGPILVPTDDDVRLALEFGAASKDKQEPLDYAYLIKSRESALNSDSIYVTVTTPLALIAMHAREQAKEYRKPDDEFVSFARALGAVAISVSQQFMTTNFRTVTFDWQLILLRDGVRVEPLKGVASWNGGNPFTASKPHLAQHNATLAAVQQAAAQQLRVAAASMDEAGRKAMVRQLAATGWSDAQICSGLGWSPEELAKIKGEGPANAAQAMFPLAERDAVFSIEELRKPGRYEIVFRRPEAGLLGVARDKEVRFAISFDHFR